MQRKNIKFFIDFITISFISFACIELLLQILLRNQILELSGVLKHQNISKLDFDRYLNLRDEYLGWPSALAHGQLFNKYGYRHTPEGLKYKNKKACIAIFGDSQGYGLDVTDEEAWSNILSHKMQCKIENYSVPAYGTDQAFLRFKKIKPKADTVIITFIDDNLRRNFIQFWDLQLGEIYLERTKPRFIFDHDGNLKFIPLPINNYQDLEDINNWHFDNIFKHETFIPNSAKYKSALRPYKFAYSISLTNSIFKYYITKFRYNNLISKTILAKFVDKRIHFNTASQESIKLQAAILREFVSSCSMNHKRCLILRLSMNFQNPENESINPIVTHLENNSLIKKNYINGNNMAKCMHSNLISKGLNQNELDIRMPGGHYSPQANAAIADCLHREISEE